MHSVLITISNGNTYWYDSVVVTTSKVCIIQPLKYYKLVNFKVSFLDGVFLHHFINELKNCISYKNSFLRLFVKFNSYRLDVELSPIWQEILDYDWNLRISKLVFEYSELDHALSWLSTLGGAFSALGDYFVTHAEVAGKISIHQLKIALKLNDPTIVTRCYLYYSLSLIQKCKFKQARIIILSEYNKTKTSPVVDNRLINMCKGIWSKLNYERSVYKATNKISKIKI